ncbi:MAG: methionyl-tRNA formyltransferase [Candidatus Omnitrophica bacterium]|jgi:methionyl-tRNA formyltransferase|nr:methionyl-tRNA formyltransferase [Candidatus Omnitrophota bacterium]
MKIVFFGSDEFAVPSLKFLKSSGNEIACVVTQPDRKKGRHLHLEGTPVKNTALELSLEIFQPQDINSVAAIKVLKGFKPDLFVVIAYGQILSSEILTIPKILALNIHASLLPKYRGAAPINWVIIRGEKVTGVTAMKIKREMDAGEIILQEKSEIDPADNAVTLAGKLSLLGSVLLIKSIKAVNNAKYKLVPQEEKAASLAPKMKKNDGLINWNDSAQEINNLIRGCYDWPGAFTYYKGKLLKIFKANVFLPLEPEGNKKIPGEIIRVLKDDLVISTGKGDLVVEELQVEGKRRMQIEEFIAGHKIAPGEVLGKK